METTCPPLQTGQRTCHDASGTLIDCKGSGQDAEFQSGTAWPVPRFSLGNGTIIDQLTGLHWSRNANIAEFPMTWPESLTFISQLNNSKYLGYDDWRLPNRRELRSLISHQTRNPALPRDHPFENLFISWYWTSTTAAISPAHAWYIHLEGARMFYGGKDQSYFVWPVRGHGNGTIMQTGQLTCHDNRGNIIDCDGSGQDGEFRYGEKWPDNRLVEENNHVRDALTGLVWYKDLTEYPKRYTWDEALNAILALKAREPHKGWKLPNINELESLVDCNHHNPALPNNHCFSGLKDGYWSSTTSMFEPDWAWVLYLNKGAIGVGQKAGKYFHLWPVHL